MALVRAARRVLALMITTSLFSLGLIYQAQAQTAVIGLDPTFDQDGKRTTDFFGQDDQANAVALQSDGKLVVVGTAQTNLDRRFAVARYNPNGSLDATFGSGGKLTTDFPQPFVEANAVALQPDGKIVVAGSAGGNFALVRYNPDGKLDHSFGGDGRVITDYSSYVHFAVHINTSEARAVALQPDGKIVAAGWVNLDNGNGQIALARYNPNGQLDTSFDSDGKVMTNLGSNGAEANGIAIQPNGKIVVAGLLSGSHRTDSVLARYNRNGSLDTSFDSDGKRVENFYNSDEGAWAVALQPDGKIVTVGIATNPPSLGGFAVRRYNPDGSRDTTFGSDGNVLTDFFNQGAWARAVVIQPDGKIVVAGWAFKDLSLGFALARYQTDGTLDTSFDSDGRLTTNFSCARAFATGLALQPDGKIVAAGSTTAINEALDFAIARYSLSEPPATPGLLSLTLNDGNVGGCQTTTGVVTLNAPAPPEGITVSLTDTDAAVSVPASITVPAGETTACFQVDTTTVSAARGVSITARLGTVTKRVSMKVRPIGVQAIGLHSSVVREFETVAGTVTLECPAPVGGVVVTLSSSNPAVASPTVGQLIIPAGEMTGTFTVRAGDVTSRRSVQIRATLNGTSRAFPLIVYN
jgi:uncharacterized delta-60 repeat protein